MKRLLSMLLVLSLAIGLTGCESIQRKFTRKKKHKPQAPKFYQEGAQETRSNADLYMMHYIYWKTWHEDLATNAGTNAKRDRLACNEVINHLKDMKGYLLKDSAIELGGHIESIEKIASEINTGGSTAMRLGILKKKLGDIQMRIMKNFYYKKVKESIRLD